MTALPCIRCGKQLQPAFRAHDDDPDWLKANQPYAGTTFRSHGQYGSTVFDEMGRTYLELNICDACMLQLAADGHILHVTRVPHPDTFMSVAWEPGLVWCEQCGRATLPPHDRHDDEPPF